SIRASMSTTVAATLTVLVAMFVLGAALALGVAENFAGFILGAEFQTAFVFLLLVVILVWRRFWLARERRYLA
ncbi:MAG TPA: hypothetical protein VE620_09275, partial [Myxococcales bacterium]|nr:hypothetical protein [Myxococcales bacterium]